MSDTEQLAQRAATLEAERIYWESERRRVNLALAQAFAPPGQFTDNAWEQLRSQQANAAYRLEQIALEMERVRRAGDAARDIPQQEEAARVQKVNVPDQEREQNVRALAEGEQQQDTGHLTRERQDKETLGRAERERLEVLEREKGASEERADRAWHPSIAHDMESEYQYVRDQIHKEWKYNLEQTVDAVHEARFAIAEACANPVSEREALQAVEQTKQQLVSLIDTELFQAAESEHKKRLLEEVGKERQAALQKQFDSRRDDYKNEKALLERTKELQDGAMELVKRELEIQKKLDADLERLKETEREQKELQEQFTRYEAQREENIRRIEERAARLEADMREKAEKERIAQYERWLEQERARAETRRLEELRRQEEEARQRALEQTRTFGL